MAEFLVIRLPEHDRPEATWIVLDEAGAVLQAASSGPLSAAAAAAHGRRVIVLAPARDVLRSAVQLPVRGQARVLQALPYALEEQLAEDVETLHFAADRRQPDGCVPVAVVRAELLRHWLAELQAAAIEPQALYAESDGLDAIPGTAVLLVEAQQLLLRDDHGQIAVADTQNLSALLQLWLAGRDGEGAPHLLVYLSDGLTETASATFESLRARLAGFELKRLPDGPLARLGANVVVNGGVNLLQGPYARRSDLARFWPAWRLAAGLLLAVAVLAILGNFLELRRQEARAARLQAAIEQAFRHTFPDARQVRGTRAELQSRLRALGAAGAGDDRLFLEALDGLARAILAAGAPVRVDGLDYRSGIMELRLRVPDVETLDKIEKAIDATAGLAAEIQSANADGEEILGRLRLQATEA